MSIIHDYRGAGSMTNSFSVREERRVSEEERLAREIYEQEQTIQKVLHSIQKGVQISIKNCSIKI